MKSFIPQFSETLRVLDDDDDSIIQDVIEDLEVDALDDESTSRANSESNGSDSTIKPMKQSVSFANIHIREYPPSLGDNPSVQRGIPISLDWEHQHETTLCLEQYEESRPPRRVQSALVLPMKEREKRLRESGFSRTDIMQATKRTNIARNLRKRTNELKHFDGFHEFVEMAVQNTLEATILKAKKQSEEDLLNKYLQKNQ